jgi:hypothetical protein
MEYTRAIILLAACSSQANALQIDLHNGSYTLQRKGVFFISFHELYRLKNIRRVGARRIFAGCVWNLLFPKFIIFEGTFCRPGRIDRRFDIAQSIQHFLGVRI